MRDKGHVASRGLHVLLRDMNSRVSFGLTLRLLVALIAFGAIPLAVSVVAGSRMSRSLVIEQSSQALVELARRQAVQIATEIDRQRVILRLLADRLTRFADSIDHEMPLLTPDGTSGPHPPGGAHVFEGFRVVTTGGRVLSAVSQRTEQPCWPGEVPATDWKQTTIAIHRAEDDHVVAYLLAVPVAENQDSVWLEAHVAAEDVPSVLAIPEHMMSGVESALYDDSGGLLLVGHSHASEELLSLGAGLPVVLGVGDGHDPDGADAHEHDDGNPAIGPSARPTPGTDDQRIRTVDISGIPYLMTGAPIPGIDWVYLVAMPLPEALTPLFRLRTTAAVGVIGLVVLILLTAFLAARSISTPLHELAAAAVSLGHGGEFEPIQQTRTDEIGLLADSFNQMASDLHSTRAEIDRLHARDLERAQQLATIGEMASGIAHEIRNPLAAVMGVLDLASGEIDVEHPPRELLREASVQLRRIEDTTSQLLRFARPPELREITADASLLAERAIRLTAAQARSLRVALTLANESAGQAVHVDPELLVQVLVNLVLNAIQACGPGGHVEVAVSATDDQVLLAVADDGPGVTDEVRESIFRPFFTTKAAGTGLGLSISRQIVERHGGFLQLADTAVGARFVISLPRSTGATT